MLIFHLYKHLVLLLLLTLFTPVTASAAQYAWVDYRRPLATGIKVCHNEFATISVNIPAAFLNNQGGYIDLVVHIRSHSRRSGDAEASFKSFYQWLKFNNKSYSIPTKDTPKNQTVEIRLKTKHLKVGENLIRASFRWKKPSGRCTSACCGYTLKKMFFKNTPAPAYDIGISSDPSGAEIYVDGKHVKTTPDIIELMPGFHGLKITKHGYETIEKQVYINSDKSLSYNLKAIKNTAVSPSPKKPIASIVDIKPGSKAEPRLPPSRGHGKYSDGIAVVIGNQNYAHKDIPRVQYAGNDAVAIKNYLMETLGYKDGNIIYETDTSKANLEMIFGTINNHRGMLYNYIKPEKSDVFIYYSGHGSPDPNTNQAYLVPTDCNPVMMDLTAYPLDVLFGNLPKIEAKSITVVLDACFSGGTNTGRWLVPNASPALIKIKHPITADNHITIFTSAENNQVSSWYPEKQHSMFTYFFLKAVTGDADFNRDKQITYREIYNFVTDRAEGVPYFAKRLHGGRIQTPTMLTADKDAVFVKY
jgi:caspase domain-containing protein/PEGA domain-containing protein